MDQPAATVRQSSGLELCTIGDLILDVVVRPAAPLARDADTPAAIRLTAGGQAANVAAWASALGARARLICKRGDDASSRIALAALERLGVEVRGPVVAGAGGVVVSIAGDDGHRTMASDRGVAAELHGAELDPAWLAGADVLHISGYCLLREAMAEAAIAAARLVPSVSVDVASANDIRLLGPKLFARRLTALAPTVVFATESERAVLPSLDVAWVTKLGARGARFPEGILPAPAVDVVDTTGAGDALAAGYLVGGPELAIQAAARCVGLVGATPSDAAL